MNRWPFAGGPEQATLAQILMYQEALHQLDEVKQETTPKKPRRLKGKNKEDFYRMVEAQARANQ